MRINLQSWEFTEKAKAVVAGKERLSPEERRRMIEKLTLNGEWNKEEVEKLSDAELAKAIIREKWINSARELNKGKGGQHTLF